MTDRIVLTGLRLRGRHGVYASERESDQEFVVDAMLEFDAGPAATSDDIADTIHYGELANRFAEIVGGSSVNLLETLAQQLAEACLVDTRVHAVEIAVHKPNAPMEHQFDDVAVAVRRERIMQLHPKFRRIGTPNLVPVPDKTEDTAA